MLENRGTLYFDGERDEKLSGLIFDKQFGHGFDRLFSLRGFWVFHSKKLNQVMILLSRRRPVLGSSKWRGFDVWAEKELDLGNIFEEFGYPKGDDKIHSTAPSKTGPTLRKFIKVK